MRFRVYVIAGGQSLCHTSRERETHIRVFFLCINVVE